MLYYEIQKLVLEGEFDSRDALMLNQSIRIQNHMFVLEHLRKEFIQSEGFGLGDSLQHDPFSNETIKRWQDAESEKARSGKIYAINKKSKKEDK